MWPPLVCYFPTACVFVGGYGGGGGGGCGGGSGGYLSMLCTVDHRYHGSAFGYGDFGNNGFYRAGGRELHHYRSGLNAIPSAEGFLSDPTVRAACTYTMRHALCAVRYA